MPQKQQFYKFKTNYRVCRWICGHVVESRKSINTTSELPLFIAFIDLTPDTNKCSPKSPNFHDKHFRTFLTLSKHYLHLCCEDLETHRHVHFGTDSPNSNATSCLHHSNVMTLYMNAKITSKRRRLHYSNVVTL